MNNTDKDIFLEKWGKSLQFPTSFTIKLNAPIIANQTEEILAITPEVSLQSEYSNSLQTETQKSLQSQSSIAAQFPCNPDSKNPCTQEIRTTVTEDDLVKIQHAIRGWDEPHPHSWPE